MKLQIRLLAMHQVLTLILNLFGVFIVTFPDISFLRPIYLVISGKTEWET